VVGVYSNEIATTSWVNTELVGNYALLNPSALQIWGTNQNQFDTQVNINSTNLRFVDGANSSLIYQSSNNLRFENTSNSNTIQMRTRTSGGAVSQNI